MQSARRNRHVNHFEPGRHAAALDALPRDPAELCAVVQGLLLHDHFGGLLYGEPPEGFAAASRETLAVETRLDAILAADPPPLTSPRAPSARAVGTCRDFALLLAAFLRHQGTPARVRCGFADYFGPESEEGRWEDHWVCQYRDQDGWRFADAQLDRPHRKHLGIGFDPAVVPPGRFRPAHEIWRACQSGAIDPDSCGHGETAGAWFIQVNLQRDLLALDDELVSGWDGWRNLSVTERRADTALCDALAARAEAR